MIFGFFFLWDLPTITAGVSSLSKSRLGPLYSELVPVMSVFGKLFGRALEAQARIALVNTALTLIGMWLLAIPGIGLLSMFVFICSFIPIAGVIISTTPIGFVALTEYGFIKLALVILMVTAVHFVEVRRGFGMECLLANKNKSWPTAQQPVSARKQLQERLVQGL